LRRRSRRGLNRIGVLAMALLLALGAMGTAYGAWSDEIYIQSTITTGDIDAGLACSTCWEEPDTSGTDIDCTKTASMTLVIDIDDALEGVDYYCNFNVSNAGSLPIKIKTMNLTNPYTGVTAVITDDLEVGDMIDPGTSATGKVHIHLTSDKQVGQDLAFTLSVSVERWNEA